MAEVFIGQINIFAFNYAPVDWAFCDGSTLQVAQYQALYALLGQVYGGTGQTSFNLPDLRGRLPLDFGVRKSDGAVFEIGASAGASSQPFTGAGSFTLTTQQLPAHNHPATFTPGAGSATATINISKDNASSPNPTANGYFGSAIAKPGTGASGGPVDAYVGTALGGTTALNTASATINGSFGGTVAVGNTGGGSPVTVSTAGSVNVTNPYLALNFSIALTGIWPSRP